MLKNLKYYAGLIDADGSFDYRPAKRDNGSYYINLRVSVYQKDKTPLIPFAEYYGVPITVCGSVFNVTLHGAKARSFTQEALKHLVIKKGVAKFLLDTTQVTIPNEEELKKYRAMVKYMRSVPAPEKPYPSRKWMAGYVDGDGCILSSYRKKDGVIEFKLLVVSHYTQVAGLHLMQKFFGGTVIPTANKDVYRWGISLSISQGKRVLEYFSKHLVMKKEQADLVLECLRSKKHIRRCGATKESNLLIHKKLQSLKDTRND